MFQKEMKEGSLAIKAWRQRNRILFSGDTQTVSFAQSSFLLTQPANKVNKLFIRLCNLVEFPYKIFAFTETLSVPSGTFNKSFKSFRPVCTIARESFINFIMSV